MKKYLVRAIPREGRIRMGDEVFFKVGGKWIGPADFDSMLGPQIEDVKRAVYYLCSRDIQIGDIVTEELDNGDFGDFEIHTQNDIFPDMIAKGLQFKLLHPVSPQAVSYVNETDEFTEEEVELWWWSTGLHQDNKPWPILRYKKGDKFDENFSKHPEAAFLAYKLKCPWGHFH